MRCAGNELLLRKRLDDRFWQFQPFAFFEEAAQVSRVVLLPSGHKVGLGSVINHLHDVTTCLAKKCPIQIKAKVKNYLSHTCKIQFVAVVDCYINELLTTNLLG